jgi:hypothetical protein
VNASPNCTTGWIETVPFSGDVAGTMQNLQFQGYRGCCTCGWRGPTHHYVENAQQDVHAHNGAVAPAPRSKGIPGGLIETVMVIMVVVGIIIKLLS